jgi:hypothetical protein
MIAFGHETPGLLPAVCRRVESLLLNRALIGFFAGAVSLPLRVCPPQCPQKARGTRLGTTPLGFVTRADDTLTMDETEQATVNRARELRAAGHSLRSIGAVLTAEGRATKRGGAWEAATVRRLLTPRYVESLAAA